MTGLLQPLPDSSSPLVQQIQNTFNVSVTFKQRPRVYVVTVIVRGSVNNAKAVKEATVLLIEQLTGTLANIGVSGIKICDNALYCGSVLVHSGTALILVLICAHQLV